LGKHTVASSVKAQLLHHARGFYLDLTALDTFRWYQMAFAKGLARLVVYWLIYAASLIWLIPAVNCWASTNCSYSGYNYVWDLAALILAIHFTFVIATCNFNYQMAFVLFGANYVFVFLYVWKLSCAMNRCEVYIPLITVSSVILIHWLGADRIEAFFRGRQYMPHRLQPPFSDTNSGFTVTGPKVFIAAFDRLFAELRLKAPEELETVLQSLPQAKYRRFISVSGRTDGRFSLNGSDYEALRFAVLHQVGHCVYGESEELANKYASLVLDKIGASQYRGKVITCKFIPQQSIRY
jgi:hypothetical protein